MRGTYAGWLALALMPVTAAGCAGTTKTSGADGLSAAPPPAAAPLDARVSLMAEQAQRDVDDLQRLSAGKSAGTSAGAIPVPREIQWTLLPGQEAGPDPAAVASKPGAAKASQAAAGSPTPPPAVRDSTVQTNLARDASASAPAPAPGGAAASGADSSTTSPGEFDDERVRQLVVDLSRELCRQAAYSDVPVRQLLLVAATTLLDPKRAIDPATQPGLTDREREILAKVQAFFARVGTELAESGDPETVVAAVAALHKALATEPQLHIARTALCTRVGGFGDFDELRRNASGNYVFLAHSGSQAVVYVEVEDFTSQLNDKGQWITELAQQLTIYSDRDGIPVWGGGEWQVGVDRSRNRREDFFVVQVITLDERLSVGRYQLKVRVRDERSGAEAETSIDLEMVADPALAPR